MGKHKSEQKEKIRNTNRLLAVITVVFGVASLVVFIACYVIYHEFAYDAKKLARQTANIYTFGTGENMEKLIAPGYVTYFDGEAELLSVKDVQNIYISNFQQYVEDKIGEADAVECNITNIMAVSNVEDFSQQFADKGVQGVTQYRSVSADWVITGKDGGELTVKVQMFVLKCSDGWYVDYVMLPDEISQSITDEDTDS